MNVITDDLAYVLGIETIADMHWEHIEYDILAEMQIHEQVIPKQVIVGFLLFCNACDLRLRWAA